MLAKLKLWSFVLRNVQCVTPYGVGWRTKWCVSTNVQIPSTTDWNWEICSSQMTSPKRCYCNQKHRFGIAFVWWKCQPWSSMHWKYSLIPAVYSIKARQEEKRRRRTQLMGQIGKHSKFDLPRPHGAINKHSRTPSIVDYNQNELCKHFRPKVLKFETTVV